MNRQTVIENLAKLPALIEAAEMGVLRLQEQVDESKEELKDREGDLQLKGAIDGKNAEIRAAQLRQMTKMEREEVGQYENLLAEKRIELNRLLNEFRAYRSIARLLEAGVA